ncbi:MAG: metallophosphoesterase [Planctomycetia bacterium]|nr:metallophosphoesterase [Planctomycetia bacterium]
MLALNLTFLALALVGHAAFWVGLVNRWHAFGFPRPVVKIMALAFYAAFYGIPLALAYRWFVSAELSPLEDGSWELNAESAYLVFCAAYGAAHIPLWTVRHRQSLRLPDAVRLENRFVIDIQRQLGFSPARGPRARLLMHVPGNQLWQLEVSEFSVDLPRLPPSLEGLSICHWSDLHISGRIDRSYFEEIVRLTNAMQVDLIALSGDVCDVARLIRWIPETLGPAQAPLGKYFILGNHDLRTKDIPRLRGAMREAGFTDVGGRHEILRDSQILIAGDERPWFRGIPLVPDGRRVQSHFAPTTPQNCYSLQPSPEKGSVPFCSDDSAKVGHSPAASLEPLKILLAHTPDQLRWARAQRFDLMLAGHTHGGQICFPLVGPLVCPSWHGTKYSAGFFHEPPTVLHVSRGTASLFPLRINCPPELSKLVLHRGQKG